MRLFILLLVFNTACYGQSMLKIQVSLQQKSGTTGELLTALNRQPGVLISYSSSVVELTKPVQLTGREKTVEDVLIAICKKQPIKYLEQPDKIVLIATIIAKPKHTISGYVTDKKNGERLIGASISIPAAGLGTTSNTYGFFSITLEQDTVSLLVSYTGYTPWVQPIILTSDILLNVEMELPSIMNELVIVQATAKKNTPGQSISGTLNISPRFIKSVPAILSESDVLKTIQLLPGIQAGNEGSSGLYVRGGSPDQNLILLDGVPVYNTAHAFGLFSIFNADAVNNVEVLKSGFPSSYGGRLSSVVDVHMKEGDKYQYHGEGGIGIIFSKFTLEGPIQKGKSSFMVSARRTYADLILRLLQSREEDGTIRLTPFFTDVNAKANFKAGPNDHIYLSCYMGQDKLTGKENYVYQNDTSRSEYSHIEGFSWGNITGMLRWNHILNKKTFSNITATYSRYKFKTGTWGEERTDNPPFYYQESHNYFSSIRDWGIRANIDYLPSPNHFIKAGGSVTFHQYHPSNNKFYKETDQVEFDEHIDHAATASREYDAYVEDDIRLLLNMKTNIGLRLSLFDTRNKLFTALQPRFNWLYQPHTKWTFSASYSEMNQFIHLISNSSLGLPTDLWLPVTSRVPPQTARQVSAGISYNCSQSIALSMETYYKRLNNVIDYIDQTVFFNAYDNWEDKVITGKGKTYGIECSLQKTKGKLTGIVSYTLSKSTRQFEAINHGKPFPFLFDRRHEIKMAAIWKQSPRFEAGANWLFSSGRPVTLPVDSYLDPFTNEWVDVYSGRNDARLPSYHRLDVSIKFIKHKKHYTRTWLISIYNAYNQFNTFYFDEIIRNNNNQVTVKAISLFPIIPSISYQFKF
ncbi:TonB-dependent receptor [Niastella caeni]|uniref:TonB-dependent receptor n=1 Tax=Niastella caeni TaxID=2569763 RepID=A0A4S8HCJ8_9BACT|nr:TonB-dependent receptor [Niastella caeni]THU31124.1 TonB-dependent receptor [Niastella caeni]